MPRTINFLGSVALLVSSITGPSLAVIPLLYQQAGWLTPLLSFLAIALLSGAAALFVVEAMSSIEGNERFQASIEFTTIAHLFLGKKWHIAVQLLLYLALQTLVVASLLESFQSMDAFLVSVAHKTCAVSFRDGWVCVDQIPPSGGSAFSGYILGSFGTLITVCLILPLSLVRLVDNIIFQVVSFITLLVITVVWIAIFGAIGVGNYPVPAVGHDQSTVVGFVISNFAYVTTIPAWVNNTHPSVNIRLAVWLSALISCLIYIPVGWLAASSLAIPGSTTILQVLSTETGHGALGTIARVSSYLFPLSVLITSIPVFTIVIRYNLLRGNICSNKMAIFWAAIFPWFIAIPFQTNGGVTIILNWASLVFTSPANLLVPFILFVISKRSTASAVLDAHVSMEASPISGLGTTFIPDEPTTHPAGIPAENIPVVIITESTEGGSDVPEDKTLASNEERHDMMPVAVKHRVSSPSRHRYYGREVLDEGSGSGSGSGSEDRPVLSLDIEAAEPRVRRPSLSISISPSHSITHPSKTGMDEFLLMSPESRSRPHSVRSVLGMPSPRPSVGTSTRSRWRRRLGTTRAPTLSLDIEGALSTFKAFPCIADSVSTRISVVAGLLSGVFILIAFVYNIVLSVQG